MNYYNKGGGEISQGARMALDEAERMEKQGRLINTNTSEEGTYDEDNTETVYSIESMYSDQFPEDEEEIGRVLYEKYPTHYAKGGSTTYQGGGEVMTIHLTKDNEIIEILSRTNKDLDYAVYYDTPAYKKHDESNLAILLTDDNEILEVKSGSRVMDYRTKQTDMSLTNKGA